MPRIFSDVIESNKFDIVAQPYVESYDFQVGKEMKITAKLELRPEVNLGDYKNLSIEVEGYKAPEDALQKSIDSLLEQFATTEIVTGRKSKSSDIIVFDFEGFVNNEKIEHGDAKNYPMDLAHSNFIPGFAEQLVDRALEEDFDVNVSFPEEYHEKKLAGQPAVFKCKIHEIKEKVLPELNDEFAQKVGPFKTVDELKADIQSHLDRQKEDSDRVASEKAIFEKVVDNAKIDIQQSMIDRETDILVAEYKQKLEAQGFTWEQAIEAQGYDTIVNNLKEDAAIRVKNSLVISAIAKAESIKIEPGDMGEQLAELSRAYQIDTETLIKQLPATPEMMNMLSQQALNKKVTQFLFDNNTINVK